MQSRADAPQVVEFLEGSEGLLQLRLRPLLAFEESNPML